MNAIKVLVSYIFVDFSNRVVAGAGDSVGRDGDGVGWGQRGMATAGAGAGDGDGNGFGFGVEGR